MLKQLPNLISILRIFLVFPVAWSLITEQYRLGLVLFAVAGASDALDGFLAKHFGWQTKLGGFLDPLADKLLLVVSYVALGWLGLVPLWLVVLVMLRDLVIIGGAVAYRFTVGIFDAEPTPLSKVNTAMQILLVLAVVVDRGMFTMPSYLLMAGYAIVTLTTVLSGIHYVVEWSRRASAHGAK